MEDREMPRMHKYGETKTTRIMMATIRHVTAWAGRMKYQAAWFWLNRVYKRTTVHIVEWVRRGTPVSTVYRGPTKIWKIKEMNVS